MSDEIKPVPPVHAVQPNLPPPLPQTVKLQQRAAAAATAAKPVATDGYDLSAITADQAKQLLATDLMQDKKATANANIVWLKIALSRRANNEILQEGDMPALVTASVRIESLVQQTYSAPRPGQKMTEPTSSELLAKVTQFNELAASFGKQRDIMRG